MNEYVIYEIPGHKVGQCLKHQYPRRPLKQLREWYPDKPSFEEGVDYRAIDFVSNYHKHDVWTHEQDLAEEYGYVSDRMKLSASKMGDKNPAKRDDVRAKISESMTGKELSDEHKANISKSMTGYDFGPEFAEAVSIRMSGENNPNYGKATWNKGVVGYGDWEWSAKSKAKISGSNNHMSKSVMINSTTYPTISSAAEALGISTYMIRKGIKSGMYKLLEDK